MRRHKYEALIWDLGQVAFFFPDRTWLDVWHGVPRVRRALTEADLPTVERKIAASQRLFETGLTGPDEHRRALSGALGLKPGLSWDEFRLGYLQSETITVNTPLFAAQAALAKSGVLQAVISNLCPIWHRVLERAGAMRHLDAEIYSFIEGIAKPSDELVVRAIDRLGVAAEDAAVIDDCAANLIAAAGCGTGTHLFCSNRELAEWLAACGYDEACRRPLLEGVPEPFFPVWEP